MSEFFSGIVAFATVILVITFIVNAATKSSKTKAPGVNNQNGNAPGPVIRPVRSTTEPQQPVRQTPVTPVAVQRSTVRHVPHFADLRSSVEFLRRCEAERCTDFEFSLPLDYGRKISDTDFINRIGEIMSFMWTLGFTKVETPNGRMHYKLHITYRAGVKIVDAVRRGRLDTLTAEELTLYRTARSIANECMKNASSRLVLERRLHDALSERTEYFNTEEKELRKRIVSAYGALLDRRANCQGFSEAFYLLASLAGFNVGMRNSMISEHFWNIINLDGAWYYTDVTHDQLENLKSREDTHWYIKFNIARDRIPGAFNIPDYLEPLPIAENTAPAHDFYRCALPGFGIEAGDLPTAAAALVRNFNMNNDVSYLRLNGTYASARQISDAISDCAAGNAALHSWQLNCNVYGENTYVIVFWTRTT